MPFFIVRRICRHFSAAVVTVMREFTLVVVLGAALVGTSSAQPGSVGCFGDDRSDRVLMAKLSSRVMTPTVCADYCRTESSRFTYYAIQYGQECWCQEENIDLRHGEGTCDFPCSGDESIVCGGFDSFSLTTCRDLLRTTNTWGALPTTGTTASWLRRCLPAR
ncbi:unnamed protein product [Ectocarpus sp. 6 AP-2014]